MPFDRSLLTFDPSIHAHRYDGKRLLGVTTALSIISKGDAITQWAVNQALDYARANWPDSGEAKSYPDEFEQAKEIVLKGAKYAWKASRDAAADIGSKAHAWIEAYLKGEDPVWPSDPNVANSVEAALKWIREVEWETLKIEHQIYIPELGVAGICDWYARINGVLAVPDWKTSNHLYPSYAFQTAAYLKALEAEFGDEIPHRWLIRIDKNTGELEPRFLPEETLEDDYASFVSAVKLYRRESELRKAWVNTKSGW